MSLFSSRHVAAASLAFALSAAAGVAGVTTHTVDFFPELPQVNHISQLRFIGPQSGTITAARLIVEFTPSGGFNAADLTMNLVAPVPGSSGFGWWGVVGADLEWSGTTGTFTASIETHDLDGNIAGGLWGFELGSLGDPPAYSGSFSATTRFEIDIDEPCAADFNGTGGATVQDIYDFLEAWLAVEPRADFNHEDGVSVQDIYDFLTAWSEGC